MGLCVGTGGSFASHTEFKLLINILDHHPCRCLRDSSSIHSVAEVIRDTPTGGDGRKENDKEG